MNAPNKLHSTMSHIGECRFRLIKPSVSDLAWYVVHSLIPQHPGGFTFDPRDWGVATFSPHIYLASWGGHGRRYERLPNVRQVRSWLSRTSCFLKEPDRFVGFWRSGQNGLYYLDVTIACYGKIAAEQLAVIEHEQAIYHPTTGKEIPVDRQGWYRRLALKAA